MNPDMMAMLRRRFGGKGTAFAPEIDPEGLPALDYETETPGGEVNVTRPPLMPAVAHEPLAASRDESPLLDELSGGVTDDERAALNDPRASADRVAMRNNFDDMSNIFLSGGRDPIQRRPDPYKAERDDMRDWVMKRGGVARGQQSDTLNAERTGAYLAATAAQQERAAAAAELQAQKEGRLADAEKFKADRLKLEDERKRLESERDQRNKDREFGLKEKTERRKGAGPKLGPDGKPIPSIQERRQGMKEAAIKPRAGWEPIDPAATTFRDPQQAKSFDSSVAAMGAIRNHKEHVLHGLGELKAAKTPAETDIALAKINAQMGALASKLRDAEGLNNTDASNHAVDTMLSLTNGSIVNLKNMANSGRLPAILEAAITSGEANLDTLAESSNLRRSNGVAPSGSVKMKFPDGSTHDVDAEDIELARKKGGVPLQ